MNQISNPVQPATCNRNWFSAAHCCCFLWLKKNVYYHFHQLFLHTWNDIPFTLCSLTDLQVRCPAVQWLLITRWNIQSLKNRNVWGFFHWTLKSFETYAGLPRRCYLKRKRQFYSSFACFFSHSFYILFSSAARRNLFRTARRILRTSERVSKGFIVCSEINETECTLTMHLSWSIHEIHHHLKDNKRQK